MLAFFEWHDDGIQLRGILDRLDINQPGWGTIDPNGHAHRLGPHLLAISANADFILTGGRDRLFDEKFTIGRHGPGDIARRISA